MRDTLHCGSTLQRVKYCSELITRETWRPGDGGFWTTVNGYTHLCEWNPSMRKCVYGPSCECAAAPFTLNSFGFEHGSPTDCTKLNSNQCHYFRTNEGRRCVKTVLGHCTNPPDTEPMCSDVNLEDEFAAYSDNCPFGTNDDCATICKNKNSNFTGPATTILEYSCGWGHGHGRYCMCSYPS